MLETAISSQVHPSYLLPMVGSETTWHWWRGIRKYCATKSHSAPYFCTVKEDEDWTLGLLFPMIVRWQVCRDPPNHP
ncbi:hypothetical protein Taro_019375 [Colocasia esculenta]|uniref:Uncharacterized protein n=1 Tax=Colocasia esculenta TaxID=4460 RepID=A0A843V1Z9_COLES|nr:hypothetical protein [Colocasia esculenta]